MAGDLKGKINPYLNRIDSELIAKNFARNYKFKDKDKLREASKNFEAIFINMMLKSMRKTVVKSDFSPQGLDSDIFMGMFDEEISKKMSQRNSIGLSDMIYNSIKMKMHRGENNIPLKRNNGPMKLEKEVKPIPLQKEKQAPKLKNQSRLHDRINKYESIISKAADKHKVEPALIKAVIAQESGGRSNAISSSGAKGLMQLKDITAREVGVKSVFDPTENIYGGTAYLKKMLENHNGDVTLALASYNAGPGNVRKYGGIPPFKETGNYIKKVLGFYEMFNGKDPELKLT